MKLTALFFLISVSGFSQCLSGDCKNGFGKYDFGFAVYEGNFKADKPNGQGTMDYGGGDKFIGNFKDGQEDGDGKLYKNNIPLSVTYVNGKVKIRQEKTIIGGNAPVVNGCIQGDCYNGFGILKFNSGNRYEGNFVCGNKKGIGKFFFADGNVFDGNFANNDYTKGSFFYAKENATFNGVFNSDGTPKTGEYKYPNNRATVSIVNGSITKIDNPVARRADSLAIEAKKDKPCSKCSGKGMFAGAPYLPAPRESHTISYYSDNGYGRHVERTEVISSSSSSSRAIFSLPTECSECHGTGVIKGTDYQTIKVRSK
jgi:hypothetical protein